MRIKSRLFTGLAALAFTVGFYNVMYRVKAMAHPEPHPTAEPAREQQLDWPVYGGQLADDHYSPLTQINRSNVRTLRVAWTFDTKEKGAMENNPLIVGRVLYAYTPTQKVIALDAATGKRLWIFDSTVEGKLSTRGLAYWNGDGGPHLFADIANYLYALDPATGKPIPGFGEDGRIDLRKGLRGDYREQSVVLTTPGIVYKDLIIVGDCEPETHPAPPGDIRAFDVRTGILRWTFHTIPHPGEFGYDTWPKDAWKNAGAANNWAGMALDAQRGIVYVPTGSAVFDFYGGDRVGDDLFSNTLLALDAETGKRIWHFQSVHHDIWDRDFPSPPSLVTVIRNGKRVDAVAQTTKHGYLFLFDRVTGHPLFPIVEEPVPASDVPGEITSPTQPKPLAPAPFARQLLTEQMLTNRTPAAHAFALKEFRTFRSGGLFTPITVNKQTIIFPGLAGGAEWGGSAVDPVTSVIYVNANELPWDGGLTESKTGTPGSVAYGHFCAICHGEHRQGSPPAIPSLLGIDKRLSDTEIENTIHQGKGRMPAFPMFDDSTMQLLLRYLKSSEDPAGDKQEINSKSPDANANSDTENGRVGAGLLNQEADKYQFTGYFPFTDPDGYPAVCPPWGTLNAIDLNTGKYLWKIPLGEYPALVAKGIKNTGSENDGGPIVTAGGLVFIGATLFDSKIRAFDSRTGKLLWEATLPFAGAATPASYMVDGKQYVVIAAAGGKYRMPSEGLYVAFALP